jgi:HEAT repeat protein
MALFRGGKPNVKALTRRADTGGLVAAAGYQDLIPDAEGGTIDRGAQVRQDAILALGALGPDAGVDAVRAALADPSDGVRLAAVRVAYAREDSASLAAALGRLPRERGHSRQLTIRALAELRRPGCAPLLASAVVNAPDDVPVGDDEVRLLKLLLDADEGTDYASEVVEVLLVALTDERDAAADRAQDLLTLIAPASTEGVIAELKAGAAPYRAAAVLARIKDTRALEPLMEALLHRDARVRAESARALGELRDPAAVEALIHATRDSDHRVRARAGSALDQLGMVALMVGVSTMVRPMILDAIASAETRAVLCEAQNGSSGDGAGGDEPVPDATSTESLERLLAGLEGWRQGTDGAR